MNNQPERKTSLSKDYRNASRMVWKVGKGVLGMVLWAISKTGKLLFRQLKKSNLSSSTGSIKKEELKRNDGLKIVNGE